MMLYYYHKETITERIKKMFENANVGDLVQVFISGYQPMVKTQIVKINKRYVYIMINDFEHMFSVKTGNQIGGYSRSFIRPFDEKDFNEHNQRFNEAKVRRENIDFIKSFNLNSLSNLDLECVATLLKGLKGSE